MKIHGAILCILPGISAFALVPQHRSNRPSALKMSMRDTYDRLTSKVTDKLGLQGTDFAAAYEGSSWESELGVKGTAVWMSEISPKYLTGVSYCTRQGGATTEELTINIWMGPSYDTPHMLLTFGEQQPGGTYAVTADYLVRGATPIGSDPQMIEAYYGSEVISAWTRAYNSEGAQPLAPQRAFASRLLNSPARIAVGGLTKLDADSIANEHVDRFLAWLDNAQPVMARSRGSFNLRDDKLRQYFYRGEVTKNIAELGETLGATVGACNTGPTAEAYVGGGS